MESRSFTRVLFAWFILLLLVYGSKNILKSEQLDNAEIAGGFLTVVEDNRVLRPGYSVSRGETLGIHLHAQASIEREITITSARGRVVAVVATTTIPVLADEKGQSRHAHESISRVASWVVPDDLDSGVYFIAYDPRMYFVVRPDADEKVDLLILIPSNSFNAASSSEPLTSFYRTMKRVRKREWLPFLSWMVIERPLKGYRVGFITDADMETMRYLKSADALMVLGPSGFWTRAARVNFDRFVASGGNALVFSGEAMRWQVRYDAEDSSILISYRHSPESDPLLDTPLATLNWRDPRLDYPIIESIGGDYSYGGQARGQAGKSLGQGGYWIYADDHPVLKNTGLSRCDAIIFFKLKRYGGIPIVGLDARGFPIPDLAAIDAHAFNLLGFDWAYQGGHTVGSMHILKPAENSGFVFNLGVSSFARSFEKRDRPLYSGTARAVQRIFINLVEASASGEDPVLRDQGDRVNVLPLRTPYKGNLTLQNSGLQCEYKFPGDS